LSGYVRKYQVISGKSILRKVLSGYIKIGQVISG